MFNYFVKDKQTYAVLDNGRIKILWNERWVPSEASVVILPSSITLSKSSYTLKVGGSYTISATVLPEDTTDQEFEFSSEDESIATVNSVTGKITGAGVGETNIICTSLADPTVQAFCKITVEEE